MSAPRIAVFGDLLYDCFIWADRLPRVGETVTGYQNGFYAGGKGGNQAVALSRLGAAARMLGKVGDDERGRFLLEKLRENGVDVSGVLIDPAVPTGTDCVHIDRQGRNAIIVAPLANQRITLDEVEGMRQAIEGADALVTQLQVNLDAIERALEIAHGAGVPVILNPAPACEVPDRFFEISDWVTPNETEAEFFTGVYREDLPLDKWCARVAEKFHARGVRRLIVTLGDKGAYHSDGKEAYIVPPFYVDAVDSTAAGDAFNAALAINLASGTIIREAIACANAAGAIAASRLGSMPSLPSAAEVDGFLRRERYTL
jgi:ribokinase